MPRLLDHHGSFMNVERVKQSARQATNGERIRGVAEMSGCVNVAFKRRSPLIIARGNLRFHCSSSSSPSAN